jgi:hypothetical protein
MSGVCLNFSVWGWRVAELKVLAPIGARFKIYLDLIFINWFHNLTIVEIDNLVLMEADDKKCLVFKLKTIKKAW